MSNNAPVKDPQVINFRGRASYPVLNLKQLEADKKNQKKQGGANGDGQNSKYGITVILDKVKAAEQIKKANELITRIASEYPAWKGKVVTVKGRSGKLVDQANPKAERVVLLGIALHDGEEKADKDGYGDHVMYITSSRPESKGPPRVLDKAFQDIRPEESHYPYAGCEVIVSMRFWVQDNDFGKRINAETRVVIFDKHGEPFGAGAVNPESDFAGVNLDDDDETTPTAKSSKPSADLDDDDMG